MGLMRELGLIVHHLLKPVKPAGAKKPGEKVTIEHDRRVEQKQIDQTTTLRRTTIEEIEIKRSESE